jgi:leader peptidase (prepilin peptidase) / N-methyltransferase
MWGGVYCGGMVFDLVPLWQLLLVAFGFGVIIGSFLNVYIYRFHTGKSLTGSSHCLSCQHDLRWYDLFPLLSYLWLRGRCRDCTAAIPSRYFLVELATGLLFVAVVYTEPAPWLWVPQLLLVSTLVVVAVYDLYHMVIPHAFVWFLSLLALVLVAYDFWVVPDITMLLLRLLGAVLAFLFFAGLWKYSGGRWIGLGDAKLVLPLAAIAGLVGTFSMVVLSFWVGTILSLSSIAVQYLWQKRGQQRLRFATKPLTMKSEVPFAPFLIAGFLLVYLAQVDVLQLIDYVLLF